MLKIEQLIVTQWYTADTQWCTVDCLLIEHAMALRPNPKPQTQSPPSPTSNPSNLKSAISILHKKRAGKSRPDWFKLKP